MKNYTIDGKGEEKYIEKVIKKNDGTMYIVFADGRVFNNVLCCEENLEKIIATQEEQARKGIENYKVFKTNEVKSKALAVISGIGALTFSTGITMIPELQGFFDTQSPAVIATGVGVITILGTIPALVKLSRDKSKVKELEKLRYRDRNKKELDTFRDYPNALTGVDSSTAQWIKKHKDPFCILNIDEYDVEDLEQIISNINVEKEYNFTYIKEKSKSH